MKSGDDYLFVKYVSFVDKELSSLDAAYVKTLPKEVVFEGDYQNFVSSLEGDILAYYQSLITEYYQFNKEESNRTNYVIDYSNGVKMICNENGFLLSKNDVCLFSSYYKYSSIIHITDENFSTYFNVPLSAYQEREDYQYITIPLIGSSEIGYHFIPYLSFDINADYSFQGWADIYHLSEKFNVTTKLYALTKNLYLDFTFKSSTAIYNSATISNVQLSNVDFYIFLLDNE